MRLTKYVILICFIVLSFYLPDIADNIATIPYGSVPLLNGKIDKEEWDTNKVCTVDSHNITLFLKQDSLFIYLAVKNNNAKNSGVDLYLDNMSGDMIMFHISAAHGLRIFKNNKWSDMTWGGSGFWASNLVEMIVGENGQSFIYPEIFECQISKKFLSHDTFRTMLHMKRPDNWIPPGADTLASDGWLQFGTVE